MPFALVFIGLMMIVSGAKNTHAEFGSELVQDFTGPGNFTWWIAAIGSVGAIGYYAPARPFSRAFMALIIMSMVLAQQRNGGGGFFGQLDAALKSGPEPVNVSANTADSQTRAAGFSQNNAAPVIDIPSTSTNAEARQNFSTVMNIVGKLWSPI